MKFPLVLLPVMSLGVLLCACEKQPLTNSSPVKRPPAAERTPAASVPAVDGGKLLQAFASAGAEEKSRAGKAAQALQAEAYPAALEALEKLLAEGHLTPEQKELAAISIAQIKQTQAAKP